MSKDEGAPGARVLIVEESPPQAERVRLLLEGAGYAVEAAASGCQALQRVRESPPDLIISGVLMPEMDGYALCRALKSDLATQQIPVVLLMVQKTPEDILLGMEVGADNFITKPFEDACLLERVKRICENLELRKEGHLDLEVMVRVGERRLHISADKQQMVELLFATFEELSRANTRLAETQQLVTEYNHTLERRVEELARAEEASHQIAARTATILASSLDAVITMDHEGKITDFNPAAERTFGYLRQQVIGSDLAETLIPSRLRARHRTSFASHLATGEASILGKRLELPALRADGSEFPVEIVVTRAESSGQLWFPGTMSAGIPETMAA